MSSAPSFESNKTILGTLMLVTIIIGMVKLLSNWTGFRDRAWPMLFVTIFIPFGFLWPLLSTPGR
jgi:hypothetical protein